MPAPAASLYDFILALHIIALVVAFGWVFMLPFAYALAVKGDPRSLPLLHRLEVTLGRWLVNPALLVLLGAGIFLASDGHHWSEFFVQWGLAAIVVLGGIVGSTLMPTARRAEEAAVRDLSSWSGEGEFEPSPEYQAIIGRLNLFGGIATAVVLATIVIMAVKP